MDCSFQNDHYHPSGHPAKNFFYLMRFLIKILFLNPKIYYRLFFYKSLLENKDDYIFI
jgi:hypothetical protein